MATITKRGDRWFAQVRRKGFPSKSKSFESRAEAKTWATIHEGRIEQGDSSLLIQPLKHVRLSDIIDRYLTEITPTKRSRKTEEQRLGKLTRDELADVTLAKLSSLHIAAYRDRRLLKVKAGTVCRELSLLHHMLDVAKKEWGLPIGTNPVADVRKPKLNNARDRRFLDGEYDRLIAAVRSSRNPALEAVVELAIHTGMRRGEILDLHWDRIDLTRRIVHIPQTKTGRPRTIPLTEAALAVLAARADKVGPVFQLSDNALKLAWVRAVRKSGLQNFRFHDLRHEAVSRLFEMDLSLPEVAMISGHRDPRMLFRYTHLTPNGLSKKLAGKLWINPSAP